MTEFERLVCRAVCAEKEFRAASEAPKMSIEAIRAECIRRCDSTTENLNRLRELLTEQPQRFASCRGFVRQVMKWFSDGRVSSGVPQNTTRMSTPSRDGAITELLGTCFSLYLLWAIAAENVHAKNPGVFGQVEDPGAWQEKQMELKKRADALIEEISQTFAPHDTVVGDVGADGRALITFRIAPGRVPIAPLRDCGRRLVNHLIDSGEARWTSPPPPDEPKVKRARARQVMQEVAG